MSLVGVYDVTCPRCDAAPGRVCTHATRGTPTLHPHDERWREAARANRALLIEQLREREFEQRTS